jgi:single-strand DNA-binding protein
MANINRVVISGRLTRDPELRATAGGTSVLGLGVAVNERHKNAQTGEWEDYANYVDVSVFGQRAEALSRVLAKGTLVTVAGRLRYSSWERDGQKRSKLEVVADELEIASQGRAGAPEQAAPACDPALQAYVDSGFSQAAAQGYYDEPLPF